MTAPQLTSEAPPPRTRGRERLVDGKLLIGIGAVALLLVVSLFTGVYDVLGADDGAQMFAITRIPRTIALVLAGAAMAMSGLIMQLMTQNRFVEPSTTGTTEWAGLGLILVMVLVPSAGLLTKMGVAIVFSFVGTMVFFLFLRRVTLRSSLIVPIIGIMLGAVVGSVSPSSRSSSTPCRTSASGSRAPSPPCCAAATRCCGSCCWWAWPCSSWPTASPSPGSARTSPPTWA